MNDKHSTLSDINTKPTTATTCGSNHELLKRKESFGPAMFDVLQKLVDAKMSVQIWKVRKEAKELLKKIEQK